MSTIRLLLAGFGGQGILFVGKFLAYKGLMEDKQLSWLPSYGPEMRGGTANCSVILSDEPIGSPIVDKPDCLMAMNLPSLDKFEDSVMPGGKIFIDSTLITRKIKRDDVECFYIPATRMAMDAGFANLANMILLGKMIKECPQIGEENIETVLKKIIPPKKADLLDVNLKALKMGYDYIGE
ncbi:MAG: 2-oxoacid:acceptor oxidoreductase family protein [Christensenellaceae bacterium]|nr:2-oxoacid:acceptor oxidoreductase family protein [Christensenellaceae bacterium]